MSKTAQSMNMPGSSPIEGKCRHTEGPEYYIEFSYWSDKKSAAGHVQKQCGNCGLWAIWVKDRATLPPAKTTKLAEGDDVNESK